jgi:hypothetical protein
MSYEGGGGAQGPAGPTGATGATGATGGISFSGPTNSVLWYNGTGVTGTTDFIWYNGGPGGYSIYAGPGLSQNYVTFDDNSGNMSLNISAVNVGKTLTLSSGNTNIVLTDVTTGISPAAGQLQVTINGSAGLNGQVLTSDGTITTWQTPVATLQQGILDLYQSGSINWISDSGAFYNDFSLLNGSNQIILNTNSNVQLTMINSTIATAITCWIVNVTPNADSSGRLRVWLQAPSDSPLFGSWLITNL